MKFIYFRRDRSAQNTLTLSNLSHLSTADARREVKSCFSRFGEVEDIVIEPETPGLARFGRIVFRSPASAQAAVEEPFAESEAFVAELILDSDDGGSSVTPTPMVTPGTKVMEASVLVTPASRATELPPN